MNPLSFVISADNHLTTGKPSGNVSGATRFFYSGYRSYDTALANAKTIADYATSVNAAFLAQVGDANDLYSALPSDQGGGVIATQEAINLGYLSDIWGVNGLGAFAGKKYDVIGNWTLSGISDENNVNGADAIAKYFANSTTRGATANEGPDNLYYSFDIGADFHGIVLADTSTAEGSDVWQVWDGSQNSWDFGASTYVSTVQQAWLAADLAANRGKTVVVFIHHPISPSAIWARDNTNAYFSIINAEDVVSVLQDEITAGGDIVAVVSGHHHPGDQAYWSGGLATPAYQSANLSQETDGPGITYITVRAPICMGGLSQAAIDLETANNAYALITVGDMGQGLPRIRVEGFGQNVAQVDYNNERYLVG